MKMGWIMELTNVPSVQRGKEGANGEDVVELVERHDVDRWMCFVSRVVGLTKNALCWVMQRL